MEENTAKNSSDLLETMMEEILARLPLRSIARFKSVSRKWKSTLESPYFRSLFLSVHKNTSSSWSLLYGTAGKEVLGFHGCETWDLPKHPASFIPLEFKPYYSMGFLFGEFRYKASSNGLVLIMNSDNICFVGNPVLQQWVNISSPPNNSTAFGLVTRSDEDGVVLSFKVFSLASVQTSNDYLPETWRTFVYSSETGIWTSRNIHCPHQLTDMSCMTCITTNGTIYLSCLSEHAQLIAHDFYSESDQFWAVQFPDHSDTNNIYKRALTTSGGFVMFIRTFSRTEETVFKVWRLNNESWQLLWEVGISIIGNYVPMVMDPFDSRIVYLWSIQDHHVVLCDLRRQSYKILRDEHNDHHQDFFIDPFVCEKSLYEFWGSGSLPDWDYFRVSIWLFQFVLPRWMEPMPCPPQAEMKDTTSLLSYIASMPETRRNRSNSCFRIQ